MRWIFAIACSLFFTNGWAQQQPKEAPRPYNIKVLSEHKDKEGNITRTIQYDQGGKHIIETETIPSSIGLHVPINPDTMDNAMVLVIVNKSKFNLEVYYRKKLVRSYKAVFGPHPLENKRMAGDRATPEGFFTIKSKNPNSKYDKFMLLDYPNDSSVAQFNRLKQSGAIPHYADIGGNVGIHGVWKGGDDMIEMGVCWTDGCIAIKNKDIDDLYNLVNVGTRVYIRK